MRVGTPSSGIGSCNHPDISLRIASLFAAHPPDVTANVSQGDRLPGITDGMTYMVPQPDLRSYTVAGRSREDVGSFVRNVCWVFDPSR